MATIEEIAVALMLGRGDSQTRIARSLRIDPKRVNQLKGQAVFDEILVKLLPRFEEGRVKDERILKEALELVYGDAWELRDNLQRLGKNSVLREVRSFSSGTSGTPLHKRRLTFGRAAASFVYDRIRQCNHVGVAYGETVRAIISGIAHLPAPKPPSTRVSLLPLRGDPVIEHEGVFTSPTSLAFELRDVVNRIVGRSKAKRAVARSLTGVPAIIPSHLSADADAIRRLAATNETYRQYEEGGVAENLDCILASVGVVGGFGQYSSAYFDSWSQDSWVSENLLGDFAGLLVPKPGRLGSEQEFEDKQLAWLGAQPRHFTRCGEREPGVILVATGGDASNSKQAHQQYVEAKAQVIYECCVSLNVVSCLLIDNEIEECLSAIVTRRLRAQTPSRKNQPT